MTPRVMFVAPSAYPLGGVANWLDYMVPGLRAAGWGARLALVAGDVHDAPSYLREHPDPAAITVHNPTGSHEGRVRALAAAIERERPAIVCSVNIPDTCAAAARVRRDLGIPVKAVMTIHGIQPDLFDDLRTFAQVLDGVVCTNRLASALAAEVAGPGRTHYAPYGVDLPAAVHRHAAGTRLRIAVAGRIEEWQKRGSDLRPIADALAQSGVDFELLIAGAGPDEPHLRAALAPHAARVKFLGTVPAAEMAARVYGHSDVLLLTSLWETGPLVVWEAMAHGLAVVSSRYVGAGREGALVDGVNCLLFGIGDVRQAAACLEQLQSPALRHRLAEAGRQLVAARYTKPLSIQAWDDCLRKVLAAPPAEDSAGPVAAPPAGRLDRWVGTGPAETLRRLTGRRFRHTQAGGEWPHTLAATDMHDTAFWSHATRVDKEAA